LASLLLVHGYLFLKIAVKFFLDWSVYRHLGMTGHYRITQALFPALRDEPDAAIAAIGFSCRQQSANGGFAKPKHITEILYATMAPLEAR